MITHPTVLILGAGASVPYGYPSGRELFFNIMKGLTVANDRGIQERLMSLGVKNVLVHNFRDELTYADPPSVDAFLEHRSEFMEIGKLAMALCLMPCENEERLFNISYTDDMPASWYRYLMDRLASKNFDEFRHNKLAVITFNYDRSLEHYLFTTLKHRYNKTDYECAEALRSIPFLHVHGGLSPLPWQAGASPRSYGYTDNPQEVRAAAEQIIIMSERKEEAPIFDEAFKLMTQADKIFFLGFGYHDTNLRRLGMARLTGKVQVTFGTSVGVGRAERDSIGSTWRIAFRGPEIDILTLFKEEIPL